jgi:hypothetical protein
MKEYVIPNGHGYQVKSVLLGKLTPTKVT